MQTMRLVKAKQQILSAGGYRYSFDRQVYFNRGAKKAFSIEFVEDHSEKEIAHLIQNGLANQKWQFFFNKKPSAAVAKELASVLGDGEAHG